MTEITLDHRFTEMKAEVLLTGPQAIGRILINQWERDRAAGLKTAGYVSGYRGSPLGTLDAALERMRSHLETRNIVVRPGVNEDIAATAVWGTQQAGTLLPSPYDGVFGLWYGKGPGVDRSLDALKHANLAGTSQHGGVLLMAGDDHVNKSSTTPHHSELTLMAAAIPVLHPADMQELLDYGALGYAMSRFSGLWVAHKLLSDLADATGLAQADPHRVQVVVPDFEFPDGGVHLTMPRNLSVSQQGVLQERLLLDHRIPAAQAFWRANGYDRVVIKPGTSRLGILSSGKSYHDVIEALRLLGLNEHLAMQKGLGLLKLGMVWPLDSETVRDFAAAGYDTLLVVEEKRALIEPQLREALYASPHRPAIWGKTTPEGAPQFAAAGELQVPQIALTIAERLGDGDLIKRARSLIRETEVTSPGDSVAKRTPYFCSGCPHNTSTRVPDGSVALGGVGCHVLALGMDRDNVGFTHMGAEGANWIGLSHFVDTPHVFQNMGDGTYFHSGIMAIRAAIASGVNVTYKLLYNDAVAMTGGQAVDGTLSALDLVWQMHAEGAVRIAVVADDPDRWAKADLPKGVEVWPRKALLSVEETLRDVQGTSVLIYDQVCASELRRRRKRGKLPDPDRQVVINDLVCEGCGDCSAKSNCISVVPKETPLGRKRSIDQASCNKDAACVDGFCPSFLTIAGATKQANASAELELELPDPPEMSKDKTQNILITGIGGTGVVTIGAVLAMAAHIDGKACSVMDMTGMAQKGGAVLSHVRLAKDHDALGATRLGTGSADVLLGCDMVVAASEDALGRTHPKHTEVLLNTHQTITGQFVLNPDLPMPGAELIDRMHERFSTGQIADFDAHRIARSLAGDAVGANMVMLGAAWQKGLIPVSREAIEQSITLNKIAVAKNKLSFALGRLAMSDPAHLDRLLAGRDHPDKAAGIPASIEEREAFLAQYQNRRYGRRYRELMDQIAEAEARLFPDQSLRLTPLAAHSLFRLMAIKDEYEVARLHSDPEFQSRLRRQFGPNIQVSYHLAPPFLARRDPYSGQLQKQKFGPWMRHVFKVLSGLRGLRGSLFDPFARSRERRVERALRDRFMNGLQHVATHLSEQTFEDAVRYAQLAQTVRGYGHVKEASIKQAASEWQTLERELGIAHAGNPLI